jgi:DNA-directed RNA polymerase subunit RPC12/RpoP
MLISKRDWYGKAPMLFAFIALIGITSVFLLPHRWYLWLTVLVGGAALLVTWHTKNFAYLCPRCGDVFEVSMLEDLLSPNGGSKKYVKCPQCRKRAWADILRIKEQPIHKK